MTSHPGTEDDWEATSSVSETEYLSLDNCRLENMEEWFNNRKCYEGYKDLERGYIGGKTILILDL